MHIALWILIIAISIVVMTWVILTYHKYINRQLRVLSEKPWFSSFLLLLFVFGFTIGFYFLYGALPEIYFNAIVIIMYTIFNIVAIFLSWRFFDATHCYDFEGNPLPKWFYKEIGEDRTHVGLLLFRIGINIVFSFMVWNQWIDADETIQIGSVILNPAYLTYGFLTAIFATETIFNIYANLTPPEEPCDDIHRLCREKGLWCDEPSMVTTKKNQAPYRVKYNPYGYCCFKK